MFVLNKLLLCCVIWLSVSRTPYVVNGYQLSVSGTNFASDCLSDGGGRWKMDACNWCRCFEGMPLCTRKNCKSVYPRNDAEKRRCEGTIEWKVDCNWCRCENGAPSCSSKFCGIDSNVKNAFNSGYDNPVGNGKSYGEPCVNGTSWSDDCNKCYCIDDLSYCTGNDCLERKSSRSLVIYPNKECREGSRWKNRCNWCYCKNDIQICNKKDCSKYKNSPNDFVCEEPSQWREKCNICTCVKGKAECSNNICHKEEKLMCQSGSWWNKECSKCYCKNGEGFCTQDDCSKIDTQNVNELAVISEKIIKRVSLSFAPLLSEKEHCTLGSSWKKECNWCHCLNNVQFCTRKPCKVGYRAVYDRESCVHLSHWRENCMECVCVKGKVLCTKFHCVTDDDRVNKDESSGEDNCKGKIWWQKGCNRCYCIEKRSFCTRLTCNSKLEENKIDTELLLNYLIIPDVQCTDGSRWKRACNWCRCNNGILTCDRKKCLLKNYRYGEAECLASSQWNDDCNTCLCFGGNALCSERNCTKEDGECKNGSEWRDGCDSCICKNGYHFCSPKYCQDESTHVSEEIVGKKCDDEDLTWMEDCNECRCFSGHVVCTDRDCVGSNPVSLPVHCHKDPIMRGAKLCGGFEMKWTYRKNVQTCVEIVYGGCGGSENLFDSHRDCITSCGPKNIDNLRGYARPSARDSGRCYRPVDAGHCFGYETRYAFNPHTNMCQTFIYGGCQGNQNNFLSAEECEAACAVDAPSHGGRCGKYSCPWHLYSHYFAKDCKPIFPSKSCCPTSFECGDENLYQDHADKCYYRGTFYPIGLQFDTLTSEEQMINETKDSCLTECFCSLSYQTKMAHVSCTPVKCPSEDTKPDLECRALYQTGECCQVSEECLDDMISSNTTLDEPMCTWDDEPYLPGDKIYFDELPCVVCICSQNFTGPEGEGCEAIECSIDLRYRRELKDECTPVYFRNRCCPIDWICPGDASLRLQNSIQIRQISAEKTKKDSTKICIFGEIEIAYGEFLILEQECQLKCTCFTPPELTCISDFTCAHLWTLNFNRNLSSSEWKISD